MIGAMTTATMLRAVTTTMPMMFRARPVRVAATDVAPVPELGEDGHDLGGELGQGDELGEVRGHGRRGFTIARAKRWTGLRLAVPPVDEDGEHGPHDGGGGGDGYDESVGFLAAGR